MEIVNIHRNKSINHFNSWDTEKENVVCPHPKYLNTHTHPFTHNIRGHMVVLEKDVGIMVAQCFRIQIFCQRFFFIISN